jgi:large subunit ribosomal protein L1
MGSKRNVDMSENTDVIKHVQVEGQLNPSELTDSSEPTAAVETPSEEDVAVASSKKSPKQARSKKYAAVRAKLDKTKVYPTAEAVKILQQLSYSKFDGTISVDGMVREVGNVGTISFPHTTGQLRRVVIVDDKVLADIEAGKIEFDVLIAHPQYMPKLAKYARVLGPKGLMPNPKTGTLTPNPEVKQKELAAGVMTIKTEKKLPIIHMTVGKVSMKTEAIAENIEELIRVLGPKLLKLSISATMSPSVKIDLAASRKEE